MKTLATKKPLIGLLCACLLTSGAYWIWQRSTAKSPNSASIATAKAPERPTTAVVTERDIHFAITAAGEIGPLDAVNVRPEIGGLISKLTLDIGDKVKKGDILFELNDKELQTEKSSRLTEITGAQLAVETQRLLVEKARLNLDRVQPMFASQLVSQEAFDNSRLDYELARNSLTIASNRLETARTALQQVEDKLLKTVIRAPFDCTILARPVSVGQAVSGASGYNSGTEVFTVANLADMIITAHVNQSDVTRVVVGQAVKVEVEAVAGLALTGRVDRIAPLATIKGGVKGFATRIRLQNAEDVVRPGMTANLSIPLIAASHVLTVPLAAVFSDKGESYVYLRKGGAAFERQPIQVGRADYDFAEVTQGLKSGDIISLVPPAAQVGDRPSPGSGARAASAAK